jgi:hypothetical protein
MKSGRGLSAATEPVGEAVSFPPESIRRISCALVHRSLGNDQLRAAMQSAFGFIPSRCDADEVARIGSAH